MFAAPVREDMGGFYLPTMQIPDYKAKALYAHLKRIVECAKYDPTDTKTANALRLAKGDLRTLEKYLPKNKTT